MVFLFSWMKVKEVMKQPFVVDKDISLKEAAKIMSSNGIGSLIFVSGNDIRGIITDTDLVRNYDSSAKIKSIMSAKVITISPDENLENAAQLMRKNAIKRLPVVDNGKLVGIVTVTELIAHADELDDEFFFD